MKRGMVGGAYRGPVAVARQRRTIRLVQAILVLFAVGLLMFAGYALGRRSGYEAGARSGELDAPRKPALVQTLVLGALGLGLMGAAVALQGEGGVRLLTPAKLREMEETGGGQPIALAEDEDASKTAL